MPRPKKPRCVSGYPIIASFVPRGVPPSGEVRLSVEELEAIRLSDFEGLDQQIDTDPLDAGHRRDRLTLPLVLEHEYRVDEVIRTEPGFAHQAA